MGGSKFAIGDKAFIDGGIATFDMGLTTTLSYEADGSIENYNDLQFSNTIGRAGYETTDIDPDYVANVDSNGNICP